MPAAVVLWYRRDLRIADHTALRSALAEARRDGATLVPLYIHAPGEEGAGAPGGAGRWWLHHSLAALDGALRGLGSRLVLRRGESAAVLRDVLGTTGARSVHATALLEPAAAARDEAVSQALAADGARLHRHEGAVLYDPDDVRTRQGGPYRVFTPFWRACQALGAPEPPLPAPQRLPPVPDAVASEPLAALGLLPRVDWAGGLREAWTPGEADAQARLAAFGVEGVAAYPATRDLPGEPGTSRLSPHLHFGELSPRQAWHGVGPSPGSDPAPAEGTPLAAGIEAWRRQLGWREFARHLLHHYPHTPDEPLDPAFARFPWREHPAALEAWHQGRTGYPLVDAGLRELWTTGWMHNRVRMVAGSFLVKHLLLPWQAGAAWFRDTLVDADLANNTLGWQWVAGSGADAAPYFRIFNPVRQAERFDPEGRYVRRWLPELATLPTRHLHAPWTAPAGVLAAAGVRLGRDYPAPIVEHAEARQRALAAYRAMRVEARP